MADNMTSVALDGNNTSPLPDDAPRLFEVGKHLLRQRRYKEALVALKEALEIVPGEVLYQSYYGLCLVETRRDPQKGLTLCRQAVRQAFYHADLHINLARAYLTLGDRRRAMVTLEKGVALEPSDPSVGRLISEMGRRRNPVFPFLRRGHPINRAAGRIRHALLGPPK